MKTCAFYARPAALSLALAAAFPAFSQAQLKETVVTATRSESRADAVLADVTVISREDIERNSGRTLAELVARMSGVQTSANGGLGKNSSVFIRGTDSRHTMLLVDGVRLGSATAGTPSLDNIPLDSIERIEVLKGPASALYGSDAIGGVIQIFTRKGTEGFKPYASFTLGSNAHHDLSAGLLGGADNVSYSLGVQTVREKGFSTTNASVDTGVSAAFRNFNPDRDGFSQDSVNASVQWRLVPDWSLDARVLRADGVTHSDDGLGRDTRANIRAQILSSGLKGKLTGAWTSELRVAQSMDASYFPVQRPGLTPDFKTTEDQWLWQNEIDTPIGKVLAGYEHVNQKVDSAQAYAIKERSINSWFTGVNGSDGRHSWQANLRRDSNSQFGQATTGLAAYGFQLTPNWRVHASHGTSFKAPHFNTLYFVSPSFVGNPTTQPERGRNTEVALAYAVGLHEVKLTHFENKIRGFITTVPVVVNIPRVKIEGWTLGYEGQLQAWSMRAAMDWLDARNELNNLKLNRRADRQLTAAIDYGIGRWKFGASLLAMGKRFDNAANTVRLGGFTTVDLYADYAVAKDWSVQARLNNLADKQYETARGYNQPDRAVFVTLRYQPK